MDCFAPVTLLQEDGNKQTIPCGKCIPCLQARRSDWTFRIQKELKKAIAAKFITLTYSDDNLPYSEITGEPELSKEDLQSFIKRLKTNYARYISTLPEKVQEIALKHPKIKYYAVGEYSPTGRPHYHILLFNLAHEQRNQIEKAWTKEKKPVGIVHIGSVETASIHYVTGYIINPDMDYPDLQKPFALISNGIGIDYISLTMQKYHQNGNKMYVSQNGTKQRMPRYYKDKFFSAQQKKVANEIANRKSELAKNEEFNRLIEQGDDPIDYQDQQRIQKVNKAKKSNKNKPL